MALETPFTATIRKAFESLRLLIISRMSVALTLPEERVFNPIVPGFVASKVLSFLIFSFPMDCKASNTPIIASTSVISPSVLFQTLCSKSFLEVL